MRAQEADMEDNENELNNRLNKRSKTKILDDYFNKEMFKKNECIGHGRNGFKGHMACENAFKTHHASVYIICRFCKKDKQDAEEAKKEYVGTNNGFGCCSKNCHVMKNLMPLDETHREYLKHAYRKREEKKNRDNLTNLPFRCSGKCGKWFVVDAKQVEK